MYKPAIISQKSKRDLDRLSFVGFCFQTSQTMSSFQDSFYYYFIPIRKDKSDCLELSVTLRRKF